MDIVLNAVEARVLGALIEKDITTPDYYPLSLNALVNACSLQKLKQREPPLAVMLPRQPGTKESRYAHLLAGEMETASVAAPVSDPASSDDRVTRLAEQVAALQREIAELRAMFEGFRKQFE